MPLRGGLNGQSRNAIKPTRDLEDSVGIPNLAPPFSGQENCLFFKGLLFGDFTTKKSMEIIHWFGNHWNTVPRLAIGILRAPDSWETSCTSNTIYVGKNWHTVRLHIHYNKYTYNYVHTYTKSKSHVRKALKILCYTLPSFFCSVFFQSFFQHRTFEAPNTKTTLVGSVGESSTGPW